MPWCPKCRFEYQQGITNCADCGEALVDQLPKDIRPPGISKNFEPCLLLTVYDSIQAQMILHLLINEGFDCYSIDRGNGAYLKVYMGISHTGEDIYIEKSQYNHAKEFLESIQKQEECFAPDDNSFPEDVGADEETIRFYRRKQTGIFIFRLLIGLSMAPFLFLILKSMF